MFTLFGFPQSITRLALAVALLATLIALQAATAVSAAATTLYVSPTGSDANPCTATLPCKTIGHAISIAPNGTTIRVAAGHYYENLTVGPTGGANPIKLTIHGAGLASTIIDGSGRDTVITVTDLGFLTLTAIAIENGSGTYGGGIVNRGGLTLNKSLVSKNPRSGITNYGNIRMTGSIIKGNSSLGSGGGLINYGILTVIQTTIANNSATGSGGGILNSGGMLTLTQSTVANNKAAYQGGGLSLAGVLSTTLVNSTVAHNSSGLAGGGIFSQSLVSLYNATVAANEANTRLLGTSGGGIELDFGGSANLFNTILASNTVATNGSPSFFSNDCLVFGGGSIASQGYNLVSTISGCPGYISSTGDQIGVSALLGPLQKNGGPTQTMALLSGSPAIDAGNPAGCRDQFGNLLTVDQRGYIRPHEGDGDGDNRCDMGAYEK